MHITMGQFDPSSETQREHLSRLMTAYFPEIGADDLTLHVPKILKIISRSVTTSKFWVYLSRRDDEYTGFVMAQIDSPESDWNKREGWGFIRELYVTLAYRKRGTARKLVAIAEQAMIENGALQVYLTTDTPDFWRKLGYVFSGEVDDGNGGKIGEKIL